MKFQTINPANNHPLKEYDFHTEDEVNKSLSSSHEAYTKWSALKISERQTALRKVAASLAELRSEIARMMSLEMGKPITDSETEVKKCETAILYYANLDEKLLQAEEIKSGFKKSAVVPCPMGIIFGIMPWNFPLWQVVRFCLPTLLLGNTTVVKPSDQAAGCSLLLEKAFLQAIPDLRVFQILLLQNDVASKVISDFRVRGVSFTGSTKTGRLIAGQAGQSLKKTVLELGGEDASIIMPDADLEMAATACAKSRMINTGQSCVSSKRFFVPKKLLPEYLHIFNQVMAAHKVGDPLAQDTQVGPLANIKFKETFLKEWDRLKPWMSQCQITHHGDIFNQGAYFAPRWAVMTEHSEKTLAMELFCPAAQIFLYDENQDVFALVNSSHYGLGASIYSKDEEKAWSLAKEKLDTGMVTINSFVKSDPALPFGGVKDSGWGRELSHHGIFEFCNLKSIGVG